LGSIYSSLNSFKITTSFAIGVPKAAVAIKHPPPPAEERSADTRPPGGGGGPPPAPSE